MLNGTELTVLKDDGCNTNVLSHEFVEKNRSRLNIINSNTSINHSNKETHEFATEVVLDAEVEIGTHKYRSNWAVANCRYDMLLGILWHQDFNPSVNYSTKQVK